MQQCYNRFGLWTVREDKNSKVREENIMIDDLLALFPSVELVIPAWQMALYVSIVSIFMLVQDFKLAIPRGLATGTPYSSMGGWGRARFRRTVIVPGRFTIT